MNGGYVGPGRNSEGASTRAAMRTESNLYRTRRSFQDVFMPTPSWFRVAAPKGSGVRPMLAMHFPSWNSSRVAPSLEYVAATCVQRSACGVHFT